MAIYDDNQGLDFAALPVNPIFRSGLEAAGVSAMELSAIAPAAFHDDSQLALVGVPSESFKVNGDGGEMKLLLVPLTEYGGTDLPIKGDSVLAKMGENPTDEPHRVEDIAGMSGCPVFRIINKAGQKRKYWVVGIQSGWYDSRRVVRFCPIARFVAALQEGARLFLQQHGRVPGSTAGS